MVNREAMAKILAQQQRFTDADGELEAAARVGQALVGSDPHNTEFPAELSGVYTLMGQAELQAGIGPAAEGHARRALDLAETLVRKDPTVVDWQGRRLGGARVLEMEARAQQARGRAAFLAALAGAPDEFRRLALLSQAHPHDLLISRIASEAAVLAGDARWVAGDKAGADAVWAEGARILEGAGGIEASNKSDRRRVVLTKLQERRQGRADWQVGKGVGQGLPKYLW